MDFPTEELARRLDMIYWLRETVQALTQETNDLIAKESVTVMSLTVDQRMVNMASNRVAMINNLADGHYLPMSPGQQFAEAARYVARGLDPVKTVEGMADTLRQPTDLPAWIQRLSQAQDGYAERVQGPPPHADPKGGDPMAHEPNQEPQSNKGLLSEIIKASHGRIRIVDMRKSATKPAPEPEHPKAPQR